MKVLINSGRVVPFFGTREKLLEKILSNNHTVTISGFQKEYKQKLNEKGVTFKSVSINRASLNPLNDLKILIYYYIFIKKNQFDVVHSYTIKPNIYGSIAARLAGVKKIYPTVNGLGYAYTGNDIKNKIVRFFTSILYKVAFACSEKVFFQNSDDAKEMVERKIISPKKCIVIAGSGIDLEKFYEIKPPTSFSFIMVTRLLKSKGVNYYLEAAKIVKSEYKNVEFKLVGPLDPNPDGVKKEELQKYVNEEIVNYLGVSTDVHNLLGKSSVFVLPSYYREGVPHSILEAMATGRSILTTDSPGCKETVIEGENGFLVPTKNAIALAEKMKWMVENSVEVQKMGEKSRVYAQEKFDVEKVNNKLLKTMNLLNKIEN